MKVNQQALLEMCIDAGVAFALAKTCDEFEAQRLTNEISREIWLQLDTYFDFE